MNPFSGAWVVFVKEVVDNARDRRSMMVALLYPLMGPLLLGLIIGMVDSVMSMNTKPIEKLAVQGIDNAPALVKFLAKKDIQAVPPDDDPEEMVKRGQVGTVIRIAEDFKADFDANRPARIEVVVNTARLPGLVALNRVANLLAEFNSVVWTERIGDHGLDIQVLRPFDIRTVNVSARDDSASVLLLMIAPLFIFNVFMGGVYITIDITSGERERDSLEPLLINPLERWGLLLGKYAAAVFFTGVAVLVQLVAFKLAFQGAGATGAAFAETLTPYMIAGLFALGVPLMMVAVGVQFLIATITRSLKEAQTYLGFLPLIPALPGMLMLFAPVTVQNWMLSIPAFSHTLLIGRLIRGEAPDLGHAAIASASSLALAALLLLLLARLFDREKLAF